MRSRVSLFRKGVVASVASLGLVVAAMPGTKTPMAPKPAETFTLALTGDSILTRKLSSAEDPALENLARILRGCDAAFTNLETVLLDAPAYAMPSRPSLGAEASLAKELAWAGFNLISRANNHAGDYGVAGMIATTNSVRDSGLVDAGVGEDLSCAREARFASTRHGRIGLVSAASTFPEYARAGNSREGIPGRPGLNPLRFSKIYGIPRERFEALKATLQELGLDPPPSTFLEVGDTVFALDDRARVRSEPRAEDLREICGEIRRARPLAQHLLVSVHSHESDGADPEQPAHFFVLAARAFIDAGADAVVGHGPHRLRGIEIYKGRPIFYSLGNFLFDYETVARLPSDDYELVGLPSQSQTGDFFDLYDRGDSRGYPAQAEVWESVVAVLRWKADRLERIELHPITLGFGLPREQRGRPALAPPALGKTILDRLARLSQPLGTRIEVRHDIGLVRLPQQP